MKKLDETTPLEGVCCTAGLGGFNHGEKYEIYGGF